MDDAAVEPESQLDDALNPFRCRLSASQLLLLLLLLGPVASVSSRLHSSASADAGAGVVALLQLVKLTICC